MTNAEIRELLDSLEVQINDKIVAHMKTLNKLDKVEQQLREALDRPELVLSRILQEAEQQLQKHVRYIRYLVDHHSATCKHKSDCSLHNMPAYKNMPCDCGLYPEL